MQTFALKVHKIRKPVLKRIWISQYRNPVNLGVYERHFPNLSQYIAMGLWQFALGNGFKY